MKLTWKPIVAAGTALALSACAAVTVQPESIAKQSADTADYSERKNYFFWGLAGEHRIDVTDICPQGPVQMQSIQTGVDGLLGVITLGIYAPRTARVWCDSSEPQAATPSTVEPEGDRA